MSSAEPSPAPATPPSRLGRKLAIGALFGLAVYAAMVLWVDTGDMLEALSDFPLLLLPAAMGLSFLNYVVRFPRWERYRSLLGIRMGRGTSFLIYLAGLALTVSPGKLGEVFKSWLIRRVDGTPLHKSAPMVVAERFTDLLGFLILVAIGGIASQPQYAWIFWSTLALCALLCFAVGSLGFARGSTAVCSKLPLLSRLAPKLEGAFASARLLLAPRELLIPTALATLGWGLECLGFWLIASALAPPLGSGELPFLFAVYAFALSAVGGAVLILFPGGLGITEGLLGTLLRRQYSAAGLSLELARSHAASAVILIRLCTLWFAVLVGLLATAIFRRRYGRIEG